MSIREAPRCEASGKRCYPSRRLAIAMTRTAGNRLRAYFCDACHSWHTTHEDIKHQPRGKR